MRGSKIRTPENRRNPRQIAIGEGVTDSPVTLTPAAQAEYERLLQVMQEFGSLEVVDLIVVANAARTKDLLDKAYEALDGGIDRLKLRSVNLLTTQHRGLMRELGLTTSPNRSVFRPKPQPESKTDEWSERLKVG